MDVVSALETGAGTMIEPGAEVRELRRRLAMTQKEFAHAVGASVVAVIRWESRQAEPGGLARRAMRRLAAPVALVRSRLLIGESAGVVAG